MPDDVDGCTVDLWSLAEGVVVEPGDPEGDLVLTGPWGSKRISAPIPRSRRRCAAWSWARAGSRTSKPTSTSPGRTGKRRRPPRGIRATGTVCCFIWSGCRTSSSAR